MSDLAKEEQHEDNSQQNDLAKSAICDISSEPTATEPVVPQQQQQQSSEEEQNSIAGMIKLLAR